jgi:hypothetical protein
MTETLAINEPGEAPIVVHKLGDGGVVIRSQEWLLPLTLEHVRRLAGFALGRPTIQRYPVTAPESPQTGE